MRRIRIQELVNVVDFSSPIDLKLPSFRLLLRLQRLLRRPLNIISQVGNFYLVYRGSGSAQSFNDAQDKDQINGSYTMTSYTIFFHGQRGCDEDIFVHFLYNSLPRALIDNLVKKCKNHRFKKYVIQNCFSGKETHDNYKDCDSSTAYEELPSIDEEILTRTLQIVCDQVEENTRYLNGILNYIESSDIELDESSFFEPFLEFNSDSTSKSCFYF